MAVIDQILARAGYVKLSDYGLALTPEGRIVSLNPPVPSDGFDQRIVGWRPFDPPMGAAPIAPIAPRPVAVAARADDADDDEEWEWQLALARAKAAADEAERAVPVRPLVRTTPPLPPSRVTVARSIAPPPARVAAPIRPIAPAPAPAPRTLVPPFVRAPVATPSSAPRPPSMIPPPAPRAASLHPRPPSARSVEAAPRRLARGTGPVRRTAVPAMRPGATLRPALEIGDETSEITNDITDLAVGDVTHVDRVNLPAEPLVFAKPSALPRLTARR